MSIVPGAQSELVTPDTVLAAPAAEAIRNELHALVVAGLYGPGGEQIERRIRWR